MKRAPQVALALPTATAALVTGTGVPDHLLLVIWAHPGLPMMASVHADDKI